MQTSRSDRFTSERQTTKMECQYRERNGLDGKHLIKKTIIEPTQDRYDDQRSERCYCNEMLDDLKPSGYFQGQANLDMDKVAWYYCNTWYPSITGWKQFTKSKNMRLCTGITLE